MEKRGIEFEVLGWLILVTIGLAIFLGGYFILRAKGIDAIEFLKNLLRFGR